MAKYQFPEFDTNFKFVYDKSKPFKELVLKHENDIYLLNVRKKYTNDIYFGATFTALFLGDKPYLCNNFKCKDRGFTEEIVDNKEAMVSLIFDDHIQGSYDYTYTDGEKTCIDQDISLGAINNRDFKVQYCYHENGDYYCTNFVFDNPHAVFRGLYGTNEKEYDRYIEEFGVAVLFDKTPTDEQLQYFKEQAEISFSNVYTEINTEYSQIKVFENDT